MREVSQKMTILFVLEEISSVVMILKHGWTTFLKDKLAKWIQSLKMFIISWSAIPTLEIHPKDIIRDVHRNLGKEVDHRIIYFRTNGSPILGDGLNKSQYIQIMVYYVPSKNQAVDYAR